MSVIAWDGKTLAADKRASYGTTILTTTKIFRINGCLVGYTGDASFGEQVLSWFRDGADSTTYPADQRDATNWAPLMVITPDGRILRYERTPHPLTYEGEFFASGSGGDFALAAMHLGKTAREAVELACLLDSGCGNGVTELTLDAPCPV